MILNLPMIGNSFALPEKPLIKPMIPTANIGSQMTADMIDEIHHSRHVIE